MTFRIKTLRSRLLLLLLPPIAIGIAALTAVVVVKVTAHERETQYAAVDQLAVSGARGVDTLVGESIATARSVAALAETMRQGDQLPIEQPLGQVFKRNPDLLGSWATVLPAGETAIDAGGREIAGPYWNRLAGDDAFDPAAVVDPKADYWARPMRTGREGIAEPYLYEGKLMTAAFSPIRSGDRVIGVAGADRSLDSLDVQISRVKVLETGGAFLISHGGVFVAAPDKELIGKQTLADLAADSGNADLQRIADAVAAGRGGRLETKDPWTGEQVLMTWRPAGVDRWGYVTVAPLGEVLAPVRSLRNLLIGLGLVVLLAIAAVVAMVARRITRPITAVARAAEQVSEGDTEVALDVSSEDEVGRMARAFERTVDYLREKSAIADRVAAGDLTVDVAARSERDMLGHAFVKLVADLRGIVGRVAGTASDVSSSSQQMAGTSDETGRAVGEIASAISEIAHGAQSQVIEVEGVKSAAETAATTARQTAGRAAEAAGTAVRARGVADEGLGAAGQASAAMVAVAESNRDVAGAVGQLSAKSERIGGIVDTISGIAEQTNLLALNAAIEAARAGEQGRGFAVVAEEVRKLAEESQQAAGLISGLIGEIQLQTEGVVAMVEDGAQRTQTGVDTVDQARVAFERIGEAVSEVSSASEVIAGAIERLAGDAERIAADVTSITTIAEASSSATEQVSASTQETSASAQEIAASAHELSRSAEELERLVGAFTL